MPALTGEVQVTTPFTITLVNATGAKVTTLKAGRYQIKIKDPSSIHNFHLKGPGNVDLKTTVPEKVDISWAVELVAGSYTYVCDPHKDMKGSFTVT